MRTDGGRDLSRKVPPAITLRADVADEFKSPIVDHAVGFNGPVGNLRGYIEGFSGLDASLENVYRVGSVVMEDILENWDRYRKEIPRRPQSQ